MTLDIYSPSLEQPINTKCDVNKPQVKGLNYSQVLLPVWERKAKAVIKAPLPVTAVHYRIFI
jgi:hypothetical protein